MAGTWDLVLKRVHNSMRDSRTTLALVDVLTYVGAAFTVLLDAQQRKFVGSFLSDKDLHKDIPYGSNSRQMLDVYPSLGRKGPAPVVVFVHGGAWGTGSKHLYKLVGRRLQKEGFCAVLVNYRVWPKGCSETQANDVVLASKWAQQNISRFGGNPTSMFLMGHSSGAHISVMATIRIAERLAREGKKTGPIFKGCIGLSGVYDIQSHYQFESNRRVHEISPMKPANGFHAGFDVRSPSKIVPLLRDEVLDLLPRYLLLHGGLDTTVPVSSSVIFYDTLAGTGRVSVQGFCLSDNDHVDIHTDLMFEINNSDRIMRLIHQFCDDKSQPSGASDGFTVCSNRARL